MAGKHPSPGNFWQKLGLQFLAFLAVAILVIWGAVAGYQFWKSRNVLSEARTQFQNGNFRSAIGAAERALLEDPKLVEAATIAAESLDKLKVPEAVEGWGRVAQMRRGDVDAAVKWSRSALGWKREAVAHGALISVPEANRENAAYQATLGDVFVAQNLSAKAETPYAKAVALAPTERAYVLRHAAIVAEYVSAAEKVALAEKDLRELSALPEYATKARRALVTLKMRQKNWAAALAENKPLVEQATAQVSDQVQQLEILRQLGGNVFSTTLAVVQKKAREAKDAAAVYDWMNRNKLAEDALKWAATMEPRLSRNPEVARRIAESHLALNDWRNLRKQCDDLESWGISEHLRNAYAAKALHEMDDLISANHRWGAAVSAAGGSREALDELLKLSGEWGWKAEELDMLWTAATRSSERWAVARLVDRYTEDGSVEGLLRTYTRKTELDPTDDEARSRMVHFSLLLDRSVENGVAQARMLAKRHPGEASYAATLALAELKGGQGNDAPAAFATIAAERLLAPEIALYHGLALFATGMEAEAAKAFEIAQKRRLFPEETLLLPPAFRTAGGKQ
jgi:tetratricopeptide (TPR) repeat protein